MVRMLLVVAVGGLIGAQGMAETDGGVRQDGERSGAGPAEATSGPTTRRVTFRPGVVIDWAAREVRLAGKVVLDGGPLELFACLHSKGHESIVQLEGDAVAIYQAIGLLGVLPGHPPRWDEQRQRFSEPAGELVEVFVEWTDGPERRRGNAFDWLWEIEYQRPPAPRPWVFMGSRRVEGKQLAAERSGVAIAVVDFDDTLIGLSRNYVSRDAELWAEVNRRVVAGEGTEVTVVVRPARAEGLRVEVDGLGTGVVGGRFETMATVADLIQLQRQLRPGEAVEVVFSGTPPVERRRWRRGLAARGLGEEAVRWVEAGTEEAGAGSAGD